jgi:hypothetical protein
MGFLEYGVGNHCLDDIRGFYDFRFRKGEVRFWPSNSKIRNL